MKMLLWPFARLFGCIIIIRNYLFDSGILKEAYYEFPIICVGNLKTGGTGKSPHVLYIARFFQDLENLIILSRGYGRKSKGFHIVEDNDIAEIAGDEPLQFKQQLSGIMVAVDENRVHGIENILKLKGQPSLLILDDAFQHRYVKAGLNILLTEYCDLYIDDELLPAGRLREPKSSADRANVIIITKCPVNIETEKMSDIKKKLNVNRNQQIFFSYIHYRESMQLPDLREININSLKNSKIILLTGIANSSTLKEYLQQYTSAIEEMKYPDHYNYTVADMVQLRKKFDMFVHSDGSPQIYIVTTRKDEVRLKRPELQMIIKDLPVAVVDIEIKFIPKQSEKFNQLLQHYVRSN